MSGLGDGLWAFLNDAWNGCNAMQCGLEQKDVLVGEENYL